MGEAQGKKVDPSTVAAQAIEAQPSFGQIKPLRGQMARVRPTASSGEDVAGHRTARTRGAGFLGRRERNLSAQKGGTTMIGAAQADAHRHRKRLCRPKMMLPTDSKRCEAASFRVTPRDQQSAGPQFER